VRQAVLALGPDLDDLLHQEEARPRNGATGDSRLLRGFAGDAAVPGLGPVIPTAKRVIARRPWPSSLQSMAHQQGPMEIMTPTQGKVSSVASARLPNTEEDNDETNGTARLS